MPRVTDLTFLAAKFREAAPILRYGLRLTKRGFLLLAFVFLIYALWRSKNDLLRVMSSASWPLLIASVAVWMSVHLVSPLFSSKLLRLLGNEFNYHNALDLHVKYLPAKYLPGGIWHTVARATVLHGRGIRKRHIAALVFLENLMAPAITLSMGGMLLAVLDVGDEVRILTGVTAAIAWIGLLVGCWVLNRYVLARSGQTVETRQFVRLAVFVAIFWTMATISFLLYITALPAVQANLHLFRLTGLYLFSWGVGFLAIFAPQGVGVFEVVAASLMPQDNHFQTLLVIFLMFRLLTIIGDLGAWSIWSLWKAFCRTTYQ